MASNSECGPCSRKNVSSSANKYCTDCDDPFCYDCITAHNTFKPFATHHLIDISAIHGVMNMNENKHCSTHPKMELDLYCGDHDVVCCRSCMLENHQTCKKLADIHVVSKNVKDSTMYDHFVRDLGILVDNADIFLKDRESVVEVVKKDKVSNLQAVAKFKSEIVDRINELEAKLKTDIESDYKKNRNKVENEKEKLSSIKKFTSNLESRLTFVTKHGSDNHIFLFVNVMKNELSTKENFMQEFTSSLETPESTFKESPNLLKSLESIGTVSTKLSSCVARYNKAVNHQIQVPVVSSKLKLVRDTEATAEIKQIEREDIHISSILCTKDNRFLLCNWKGQKLLVCNDRGKYLQTCKLHGNPWDITSIPGSNTAIVSLRTSNGLQFIETGSACIKGGKFVYIGELCYGVAASISTIFVGGKGKVIEFNMEGRRVNTFKVGSEMLHYLHLDANNRRLYCSDTQSDKIYCINVDGTAIFCIDNLEVAPVDITTDFHRNVYVVGLGSHDVHRFTDNGQNRELLLDEKDGMFKPYALAFNVDYSKLVLSNNAGTELIFFYLK
ncbi:uncharacterized protein LOC127701771 [Mytilus californianus]|uniref:uncharacterized protein LOC127701771 n=1 Tax=Mytilus californianus TaxID=6549 RepID=UPI0022464601|nr:uncharacterized protein LOC127701771 [Mytilus californianus]